MVEGDEIVKNLNLISTALFFLGVTIFGGSSCSLGYKEVEVKGYEEVEVKGNGKVEEKGYEEVEVKNGGSITGKVVLSGSIPEPRVFPIILYPFGTFCKKISNGQGHILLKEFNVSTGGGLQDAVVSVQEVKRGKPFPDIKNDFIAVDCMFHPADVPEDEQYEFHGEKLTHVHPLVGVIKNDQVVTAINKDPIIHNGQVFQKERGNIVLNFPLPISDKTYGGTVHFDKGKRIAQMICGMHEFMQTWGWMVDNPYYAKTKKGGGFTIDELPPGTYKVTAWHPHIKPVVKEVTVPPNGKVSLNFGFDGDAVERPHYETQEKFRIAPDAMPELHGCEGPFCVKDEH